MHFVSLQVFKQLSTCCFKIKSANLCNYNIKLTAWMLLLDCQVWSYKILRIWHLSKWWCKPNSNQARDLLHYQKKSISLCMWNWFCHVWHIQALIITVRWKAQSPAVLSQTHLHPVPRSYSLQNRHMQAKTLAWSHIVFDCHKASSNTSLITHHLTTKCTLMWSPWFWILWLLSNYWC